MHTLTELGTIATRQGDLTAANVILDEAYVLIKETGDEKSLRGCYVLLALLVQAEDNYGGAVQLYRASLTGAEQYQAMWGPCLLGLATLAAAVGQHELTARLLGAIEAASEAGNPLLPIERDDCNRLAGAAHAHLGSASFDVAWMQGKLLAFKPAALEAVSRLEAALHIQDPERSSKRTN